MTAPHRRRPVFDPARAADYAPCIGVDEAGRGALCGPVVAAAVWFDAATIPAALLAALDDSKKLPPARRAALAEAIRAHARVAVAAGAAAAIDAHGILVVTLRTMRRSVERLGVAAPVRVDGRDRIPGLALPCEAVVRGDGAVPQIAAASIIAKTTRDRLMQRLAGRHPAYGWTRNMGYGTAHHLQAIKRTGPSPHHRLTFARAGG